MTERIDCKLSQDENGVFDCNIIEGGDFEIEPGYTSSLIVSTYLERRANDVEVPDPRKRRGWLGNEESEFAGFEMGSKIWLHVEQGRITDDTINDVEAAARQAYQWYLEDNIATSITVDVVESGSSLSLQAEIFVGNDLIASRLFELWKNTNAPESTN